MKSNTAQTTLAEGQGGQMELHTHILRYVPEAYAVYATDYSLIEFKGQRYKINTVSTQPPASASELATADPMSRFKELIRVANMRPCPECKHSDVASDGLCVASVPLVDKEPHGSKRCGCPCVNFVAEPSTSTSPDDWKYQISLALPNEIPDSAVSNIYDIVDAAFRSARESAFDAAINAIQKVYADEGVTEMFIEAVNRARIGRSDE